MTFGTPASCSTSGTCPPPQPSTWKAWIVRPSSTASVSSHRQALVEAVGVQRHLHVVLLGHAQRGVEGARCAPMSSCTLKPHDAALDSASTSGPRRDDEPRPRKPMLTGQASKAANACAAPTAELTPTPQTGPNSWPMIVVTPEASAASMIRGDSRCTWVSIAPAVAMSPSPVMIAVPVPTTTSTPSRVSGLPARPIAADPPLADADATLPDAEDGSSTSTLVTTTSQVSRGGTACR